RSCSATRCAEVSPQPSKSSSKSSNTSRWRSRSTMAAEDLPREPAPPAARPQSTARALLRLARPKQWLKNVLVVAAPGAAGVLGQSTALFRTGIAFICFCLAASGTYYINDALDVDADRRHPTKRFRPVASGEVTVRTAVVVG